MALIFNFVLYSTIVLKIDVIRILNLRIRIYVIKITDIKEEILNEEEDEEEQDHETLEVPVIKMESTDDFSANPASPSAKQAAASTGDGPVKKMTQLLTKVIVDGHRE